MLQLRSYLKVSDRTGIVNAQCLKVLGGRKNLIAYLGDMILASVKQINVQRLALAKARLQKRFKKGTMHRILLLRSQINYQRQSYVFIKFNENAGITVNRRRVPVSNRMYGPLVREFSFPWPWLACVTNTVV